MNFKANKIKLLQAMPLEFSRFLLNHITTQPLIPIVLCHYGYFGGKV